MRTLSQSHGDYELLVMIPRLRNFLLMLVAACAVIPARSQLSRIVVADSVTHVSLPRASVYDRFGYPVGISDRKGRIPAVPEGNFPLTVRYLGFKDKVVPNAFVDTVFLSEDYTELPEFVMDFSKCNILHILAYVREYSTLTTYTDTIFLFREKMVDFMVNGDKKGKFKGWLKPRVLASQSYYRFTDKQGLDSVSDESSHHFSWSDWIGIVPDIEIPRSLQDIAEGDKIIYGKYSPTEKWSKSKDRITVNINVLADTVNRKWVPGLYGFFHRDENLERFVDFEEIKLRFEYDNVIGNKLDPENLLFYSYNVESAGRGHGMFRFNKNNQRFFVSTNAEVYVLDKEYITLKEAKKWENRKIEIDDKTIFSPLSAPDLSEDIESLIDRVETLDKEKVRQDLPPDFKFVGADLSRKNFRIGARLLNVLKDITGISAYRARKKRNNDWKAFRKKQIELNSTRPLEE